jgi:hypothetical protein
LHQVNETRISNRRQAEKFTVCSGETAPDPAAGHAVKRRGRLSGLRVEFAGASLVLLDNRAEAVAQPAVAFAIRENSDLSGVLAKMRSRFLRRRQVCPPPRTLCHVALIGAMAIRGSSGFENHIY